MNDETVKMLRVCGDSNNSCGNCPIRENDGGCPHGEWEFAAKKYMLQAADAIEELVRKEKFHAFLWNTIQPNEMEQYISMYNAGNEKVETK